MIVGYLLLTFLAQFVSYIHWDEKRELLPPAFLFGMGSTD